MTSEPRDTALIFAPTGRDAFIIKKILNEVGIIAIINHSISEIASSIEETSLFLIIADEALVSQNAHPLADKLATQPAWSDFPIILLTPKGGGIDRNPTASRMLDSLGNVSFLERPFHPTTLVSMARSAVRARNRQFNMRDNLEELKRSQAEKRASDAHFSEQLRLLMREVNHRSKNLLAVVQSVARQTARETSPGDFIRSFSERLQGLSASQDLLVAGDWVSVDLETLTRSQLKFLGESSDSRIKISGPRVVVTPNVAQALGMALHELATNALKHGALSKKHGEVHIEWHLSKPGKFKMAWVETGGPPVKKPEKFGFGSIVIKRMVATSLNGEIELDYRSEGLVWELEADLEMIISSQL